MAGVSPWRVGQLSPAWQITITDDSGAAVNLTGIAGNAFTLTIYDTVYGTTRTGGGTFTVTNATAGIVTYQLVAADSATAGSYTLTVSWTSGGNPEYSDPLAWLVKPVGAP